MANIKKDQSSFKLVNIIMAAFNIGEAGKVESFFDRTRKHLNNEVRKIENTMKTEDLNFSLKSENLESEIEDATAALNDAYTRIDATVIDTNAAQDDYRIIYLRGIENAETNLELLTKELEVSAKRYKERKEELLENISRLKDRVDMISEKA